MKPTFFVLPPDQHPRALNVVGTKVSVLASPANTDGYGITLQWGDEGMGPPPHRHDWDEAFYVLDGEVEFVCAGQTFICVTGTLVHVPAGTLHGFHYRAGGGRMLEFTGTGTRSAEMFADVDREMPPGPPDVPTLLAVLARNGVQVG